MAPPEDHDALDGALEALYLSLSLYIYIYIHICVCMYVYNRHLGLITPHINKVPARPKINKLKTKIPDNPNSEKNDTQNRLSLSNIYYIKVPYFILAKGSPPMRGEI